MDDTDNSTTPVAKRVPWNKGKLTGAKPPLRPKHVWAIRTRLQMEQQVRDLALFNLAIDSELRGCDVVAVKSMTWHPTAMPSIELPCARGRQDAPSGLNSRNRPDTPSTTTSNRKARSRVDFYSPADGRDRP